VTPEASGPCFAASIDEATLEEDLARATDAGRTAIRPVIEQLRGAGAPMSWLKRCEAEHRDGTDLSGCVKFYIPQPAGPWGAVFTGDRTATIPTLVLLAVGVRHHPRGSNAPTVYQLAHRRLYG
jgi:hypothetical protein